MTITVKDERIYFHPRCHLALRRMPYPCRNTIISPATDVCPYVTEYSAVAFDCALGGPFGNLRFDPALTFPDSLCVHGCFDLRFNGLLALFN